jgi:hypothetical protein
LRDLWVALARRDQHDSEFARRQGDEAGSHGD